ncbi:hypothetical protein D3C87_1396910 [compost metagenome]
MGRIVGEFDEDGIERLDQHVDREGAGHGGEAEREARKRMSSDGKIGNAGKRYQHQIACVSCNTCKDADEGENIGQRPPRGDNDELVDQRGDQA